MVALRTQEPARPEPSERWLLTTRPASFDLERLREAIAAGDRELSARLCREFSERAVLDQADLAAEVRARGGQVVQHFWLIPVLSVDLPPGTIAALRARPDVLRAHADGIATPSIVRSTNQSNHRAQAAHAQGARGQGATVAVLDSGFDTTMGASGRPHRLYFVGGDPTNQTGGGLGGSRLLAAVPIGTQGFEAFDDHGNAVAAVAAGETWANSALAGPGHAPAAKLVGYGIANDLAGNSSFTTIAAAFQRVVQDKLTYGIVCANNSYSGRNDPTDPSQQAMDAAARIGDIVVTVAAGNEGSNQRNGPACCNGLAVGAVAADSKDLARFSSQGPLFGDDRAWPDLVACGVDMVMPTRDNESASAFYLASGTSFAAPAVCGAAALFRGLRPQASALETKAALLCSTEDVFPANQWSITSSRRTLGHGFLRDDLLVAAAQGQAIIATANLTAAARELVVSLPVTQGQTYAAVVAFHRHTLTATEWSDVDLAVRDGQGRLLAVASHLRDLAEKVVFTAPATGAVQLIASARSLEIASLPIALVAMATPPQTQPGGSTTFGSGCPGTGRDDTIRATVPMSYASTFGDVPSNLLVDTQRRNQFIIRGDAVGPAATFSALALRLHHLLPATPLPYWAELEIRMGIASTSPAAMTGSFVANEAGPQVLVFARRRVDFPLRIGSNPDPRAFAVVLPLDVDYAWAGVPGQHLLIDVRVHSGSGRAVTDNYPADGFWQQTDPNPLMSWAAGAVGSSSGGAVRGRGVVFGFAVRTPGGTVPGLTAVTDPVLGRPYDLRLAGAPANAVGLTLLGFDDRVWQGLGLPFDLAPLGAPGCALRTGIDAATPVAIDAAGRAAMRTVLPFTPTLLQVPMFQQCAVLDAGANTLGWTFTAGVVGVPGNRW